MALVVFTGGARSGKSTAAQDLARRRALDGQRVVVAVFGRESDEEMAERISRHREGRPEGFETLVAADSTSWLDRVAGDDMLLVDCLGTLVGRVIEEEWTEGAGDSTEWAADTVAPHAAAAVADAVAGIVRRIVTREGDTVVVTNEVGGGVVPAYASGRLFRDVLGTANRTLIDGADAAYLCVAGRLVDLTRLPRSAAWPSD